MADDGSSPTRPGTGLLGPASVRQILGRDDRAPPRPLSHPPPQFMNDVPWPQFAPLPNSTGSPPAMPSWSNANENSQNFSPNTSFTEYSSSPPTMDLSSNNNATGNIDNYANIDFLTRTLQQDMRSDPASQAAAALSQPPYDFASLAEFNLPPDFN